MGEGDRALEHLERVHVHVGVVVAALLHPPQLLELGQHHRARADAGEQLDAAARLGHGQDPAELREHPLGRHAPQLRRGRPCQRERLGVGLEVELHRHPGQAHDPQRVFQERARVGRAQAPGAKVLDPPERVDRLAPGERLGDRVDGEVPQPQVLLEGRRAQGLEVGLPAMLGADHPPGTMVGGELEAGGPGGDARERAGGLLHVSLEDDVDVGAGPPQQPVAGGAPDQPRLTPGERPPGELDRRGPPGGAARAHPASDPATASPSRW